MEMCYFKYVALVMRDEQWHIQLKTLKNIVTQIESKSSLNTKSLI